MIVHLVTNDGDLNFECKNMTFEGGFVVFEKEDNKEMFASIAKVVLMDVEGRPKKPVKKIKKEA
jgi:hypothetical protein